MAVDVFSAESDGVTPWRQDQPPNEPYSPQEAIRKMSVPEGFTVAQMAHAGVRRALAFITSSFSSYSGCRRYREDLFEAASGVPNARRGLSTRSPTSSGPL